MKNQESALTAGVEEYIEAMWRVAGSGQAATKALAEHLGVAPASVTGMLKRLAALKLIEYQPYGKASLTAKGRHLATQIIRRHRLSERLLTDILGISWERAHLEACRFEHLITGEVEERLVAVLGEITTCPHGHPMDLSVADESKPLSEITAPEWVQVTAISDESDDFLRYLSDVGITPGARIKVTGHEPILDGAILLEVESKPRALGKRSADHIRVIPVSRTEKPVKERVK